MCVSAGNHGLATNPEDRVLTAVQAGNMDVCAAIQELDLIHKYATESVSLEVNEIIRIHVIEGDCPKCFQELVRLMKAD